jgi:hypothetical protein
MNPAPISQAGIPTKAHIAPARQKLIRRTQGKASGMCDVAHGRSLEASLSEQLWSGLKDVLAGNIAPVFGLLI